MEKETKYLRQFQGGSMAKTYLIEKNNKQFVRKEINDKNNIKLGSSKLKQQCDWLLNLNDETKDIFPKIIDYKFSEDICFYDMEYYSVPTLRDYIFSNPFNFNEIYSIMDKCLIHCQNVNNQVVNSDINDYIKTQHLDKMLERCETVVEQSPMFKEIFNNECLIINGKEYLNLKLLYDELFDEEFIKFMEPEYLNISHGDYTLQNILTDGKIIKVIDPRGSKSDSIYYDISKLFQSCHGKYDLLFDGNYECNYIASTGKINYQIYKFTNLFDNLQNYIELSIPKHFNSIDSNWKIKTLFYEASHFISMVPFRYTESVEITLLCYAIGIEIMNEVYNLWQNIKKEE